MVSVEIVLGIYVVVLIGAVTGGYLNWTKLERRARKEREPVFSEKEIKKLAKELESIFVVPYKR